MCGICGVIGGEPARERPQVERMAAAIAHRGPDDVGFSTHRGAVLGHRRLTIIDLSTGRQPLANEDESMWITFNGEIYNFKELRAELVAAGHRFRTNTDTEAILHLYEQYGVACLARLRGMFAFAIWDEPRQRLFAARDRFGQKPLYYATVGERLLFASEIKGLLAHEDLRSVTPDPAAIDAYLALRFVPPPLTMVQGVRKLAAGCALTWERGQVTTERYWDLHFRQGPRRSDVQWIGELAERLDDAVRSHLVSDVPVGAFLSGGLDSSMVVASMARYAQGRVPTFSVGSDVAGFDETPFARIVSEQCGTDHHERFVDAGRLTQIPELVRCLDEPSDPIAACMYEVARFAAEHVKVVLGGDGGDELFAGFDRYAGFRWVEWYARVPRWIREGVIRPAVRAVPESFAYKSLTQRLRWMDALGGESGGARYARMTSFFRFGPAERAWCYGPRLQAQLGGTPPEAVIARLFESADADALLHRMLSADIATRLPEHTLMLTDRLGMAHGLETRSPLLDHELAEFCATMPARLKIRRGVTKYAVRQAARGRLPQAIIDRPKQGFMFPVAYWLNGATLQALGRQLVSGPLVRDGWIAADGVRRLVAEHERRALDHHVRIWMLLNLDAWFRIYRDGEDAAAVMAEAVGARE